MKLIIAVSCLAAFVLAAPQQKDPVPIIKQESQVNGDGSYSYNFETGDGTKAEQSGQLKNFGPDDDGEVVTGSFSYVAPDGVTYSVTYTADENGFQPQGAHLLQIPEAIARSIEYNKAHPEEEKTRK
ncbi:cuticle protein CP14.6-like [Zootermopsis nevadensis]|uniref:cuticle protein CP14.6-like n=1 Tax=Zootermopsis nevadensis TaxID=136037 RepID=UPI000B8EDADB|nr:cuticle protein CP14.6-like [Zootermopsis nevadensis]